MAETYARILYKKLRCVGSILLHSHNSFNYLLKYLECLRCVDQCSSTTTLAQLSASLRDAASTILICFELTIQCEATAYNVPESSGTILI